MSAETAGTWNVSGSSMAMVVTGLMPGNTPTIVPIAEPSRQ